MSPRTLARRLAPNRVRRTLGAASCVRERSRFVAHELRDRRALEHYHLRGSGLVAQVRHPLLDMWVLEEVFRFRAYEPPAQAARSVRALGRAPRVLDLGGHAGYFGLFALAGFPGARVVSFEPNPDNARTLRRCIEANGLGESWELVEACAAVEDGEVELDASFHLSRVGHADQALERLQDHIGGALPYLRGTALLDEAERHRVSARDVFPFLAEADLVKVDIEGGEWEILADPRLSELEAAAVVLEYHPPYCPRTDAEAAAREPLAAAGFVTGPVAPDDERGLLWAWRDR